MDFFKYSGSGNDFIMIDNRDNSLCIESLDVKGLCRRREGIGADGCVFIERSKTCDFKMRIFNADGSEPEMCGNGARCSVHFAYHELRLKKDKNFEFETMNGVYVGEVLDNDEIKIRMTELYDVNSVDISDLSGKESLYLNTGVPHAVIQVSSVDDVNVLAIGKAIRSDERFLEGTNVDFFEVIDENAKIVKLRVYERGVEDETLCCGTGIMATAVSCSQFFGWTGEININVKGGNLKAIVDKELKYLYFQGRVKKIFKGFLERTN